MEKSYLGLARECCDPAAARGTKESFGRKGIEQATFPPALLQSNEKMIEETHKAARKLLSWLLRWLVLRRPFVGFSGQDPAAHMDAPARTALGFTKREFPGRPCASTPTRFLRIPTRFLRIPQCTFTVGASLWSVTPHCTSLFEYVSLAGGASSSLNKVIQHQHQQEGDEHNSSLILTDAFMHSFINVHEAVQ